MEQHKRWCVLYSEIVHIRICQVGISKEYHK